MEWVDGNTLDVYVGTLIKQQKAKGHLKAVADEWAELVAKLEAAHIAHGDLQHGNVMVTPSGTLKLVDLDGMFVPALRGRQPTEIGHLNFQHPRRAAAPFGERLDNFSSLMIYASLLAIDENPALWDQFHRDENLILSKDDFAAPAQSKAFRSMKQTGGEVARITDALIAACSLQSAAAVPSLSSLIHIKHSRLPEWMRHSGVVTVQTKTREATSPPPPAGTVRAPAPPSQASASTSARTTSQPASAPAPPAQVNRSSDWFNLGFRRGLRAAFSAWWIGLFISPFLIEMAKGLGSSADDAWFVSLLMYFGAFVMWGWLAESNARSAASPVTIRATTPVSSPTSATSPVTVRGGNTWTTTPRPQIATSPVVGSKIRLVYHRPGCEWATKIGTRNRVSFGSAQIAATRGYRPCRVCNP